ncbi:MAG: hypothetical protein H0X36_02085 [Sphingomonadaceae bacterium]|nr:hypothetical protein [Sphingomonadaceae bacterium]
MAERDTEIAELKARIADLEARPSPGDLDWLKSSHVWKRAQFAASPGWLKFNVIGVAVIWGGMLLYAVVSFTHG